MRNLSSFSSCIPWTRGTASVASVTSTVEPNGTVLHSCCAYTMQMFCSVGPPKRQESSTRGCQLHLIAGRSTDWLCLTHKVPRMPRQRRAARHPISDASLFPTDSKSCRCRLCHPLSAPAVSPRVMYRSRKSPITTTGATAASDSAEMNHHWMPRVLLCPAISTGSVIALKLVSISA